MGQTSVEKADIIRYLGIWMDKELNMKKKHLIKQSQIAALNLKNINMLRSHLSTDSCRTLIQALVMSHLDYGNATFIELSTEAEAGSKNSELCSQGSTRQTQI